MKHTPGPWQVRPTSMKGQCLVSGGDIRGGDGFSLQFSEGNAHLVAAAPDMLEALIAIREWLLLKKKVAESGDFWRKDFAKANNLTNYAIAKAKGAKP